MKNRLVIKLCAHPVKKLDTKKWKEFVKDLPSISILFQLSTVFCGQQHTVEAGSSSMVNAHIIAYDALIHVSYVHSHEKRISAILFPNV